MSRRSKHRTPWLAGDYDQLRRLAGAALSARAISKEMERTEEAIKMKATDLGCLLRRASDDAAKRNPLEVIAESGIW